MNFQEFADLVSRNKIPSVLFFEGSEERLKQDALKMLREKLLPEGLADLNEVLLTAPETDAIIAAAETLPFMADRRLILLRDFPAVVGRSEADDRLLSYLPYVPPTAVVLFYCVQPVKQKKIKNAVQKLGGLVRFDPLKDYEATSFVTRIFRDLGRECDDRTADLLIFTCGTDLNQLQNEAAKIAAYHPENPRISPDDVRALATPSSENRVFNLVNALISGNEGKTFSLLRDLLRNGENRTGILFMLLRQFRLMQQIKIMLYEKRSPKDIQEALGIKNAWAAQQTMKQAASYTGRQVRDAVALCLNTDYEVKSGALREEGALETVMLRLLLMRKPEKKSATV